MSRQIQIRRGTAAEHTTFTGAIGEITMDTTNNTLRVHDGTTAGGTPLAKQSEIPEQYVMPENYDFVVECQAPTSSNNYTWYRKYKSGWVEQGGVATSENSVMTITLPAEMADTHFYTCITCQVLGNYFAYCSPNSKTTIQLRVTSGNDLQLVAGKALCWMVTGRGA